MVTDEGIRDQQVGSGAGMPRLFFGVGSYRIGWAFLPIQDALPEVSFDYDCRSYYFHKSVSKVVFFV
jgi:hypothetical protein